MFLQSLGKIHPGFTNTHPPLRALPHIVLDNEKKIIIQIVITKAAILYSHKRPILRIFEYLKQGKIGHLHINQICISYKLDAFSFLLNYVYYDAEQDKLSSKEILCQIF